MISYLPSELIIKIISYLNFPSKDVFLYTIYPNYIDLIKNDKLKFIEYYFHPQIINIFYGIENMINYPMLQFKHYFTGFDYIDSISTKDTSYPIMIGIDNWNRAFIAITYTLCNEKKVECIFQRYSNSLNTCAHGSKYSKELCSRGGYFLDKGLLDSITKKKIQYLINNRFNIDSF
jgi:hypothetical protein